MESISIDKFSGLLARLENMRLNQAMTRMQQPQFILAILKPSKRLDFPTQSVLNNFGDSTDYVDDVACLIDYLSNLCRISILNLFKSKPEPAFLACQTVHGRCPFTGRVQAARFTSYRYVRVGQFEIHIQVCNNTLSMRCGLIKKSRVTWKCSVSSYEDII